MPPLVFRLLGPLVVEPHGSVVEVKRAKASALAAYLACNPQRHARNHLVSLLWPEVDETRGLASLRNTLWELQRLVGSGWLETDRTGVQLRSEQDVWVDAHHFQRLLKDAGATGRPASDEQLGTLHNAVALYRGRLLEGLALPDCAAFDEWLSMTTERFHLLATQALERITSALVSRGRLDEALPHAQRLLALEPTHEEAHRALIRLYAWLGRWADALRQHQHCVDVLREELDARPQPETFRLLEQVKARSLAPPPAACAGAAVLSREEEASSAVGLPTPVTPLHGRANELQALLRRLEDPACRLLTVAGPGGIGKTRLALEAARRRAGAYRHGVRFISLDAVDSPAHFATFLVEALELPASPTPPEAQLREHLRSRELLLVLDNLEHLLEATPLLAELLAHAPGLKLLVTSRERLNLRGEWLLPLEGLAYQGAREALELFAHLAVRGEATFQLTADNEPHVARICQLVAGSPLGLELAAAWVSFFSAAELAARLEKDLDFLSSPRDAPERHHSLRATFLHSWRLLSAQQQDVLRRLAVFQGGCTHEAAAAVADAPLPVLASLVDRFLVRRTQDKRYELHVMIRQFATEELRAVPEQERLARERHGDYFTRALDRRAELEGPHQAAVHQQLEAELDNLRAAFRWVVEHRRFQWLARALEGLALLHQGRGRFREAQATLQEAVAAVRLALQAQGGAEGPRPLLGRLLAWQAHFALEVSPLPTAVAIIEEAVTLLRAHEATRAELAFALMTAGRLAMKQGAHSAAEWYFRGSLELGKRLGQQRTVVLALEKLSSVATRRGDYLEAIRLLEECLKLFRSLEDVRGMATCLGSLGSAFLLTGERVKAGMVLKEALRLIGESAYPRERAALLERLARCLTLGGELEEARGTYERSLELARSLRHPERVAAALHGLGELALRQGELDAAWRWVEESLEIRQGLHARQAVAESFHTLGLIAWRKGDGERARDCLRSALQSALEISDTPLTLESLVGLAELRAPVRGSARVERALAVILAHPASAPWTRERATRLLDGATPARESTLVPLSELIADILG
ncbi:MAG TPA: tetratricopeptide repeat protein [Myxococcaceae bacterium]|nr:tetratricopeptide repeat protein [Myxococcaceae bacterium]